MARRAFSTKFVGAHVSASGGPLRALDNAQQALGPRARAFAFFVRPRLSWKPVAPIDAGDAARFRERLRCDPRLDSSKVVVHGSYILNLGSHDAELRAKSVELMVEEVAKCAQLGVHAYVFHPGSCTRVPEHLTWTTPAKKRKRKTRKAGEAAAVAATTQAPQDYDGEEEEARAKEAHARALSVQYIGECMAQVLARTQDVALCVENMCGQGNVLGRDFGELRGILDSAVAHGSASLHAASPRLGVCLDTCHAHASGLPMQTARECEAMMAAFDAAMGGAWMSRRVLKVVHVNDSMDACGSRRDRHENIGLGRIGLPAFAWAMNSPRFDGLPMILETPRRGLESLRERVQRVEDAARRELLHVCYVEDTDANEIDLLLRLVEPAT